MSHVCASIRSRVRILRPSRQAEALIIHYRHIREGRSRLSVECTPPTLVSISSSPSPLSAKLCSMSVHRSVQELDYFKHSQLANAQIVHWRHISEVQESLSFKCTPSTLVIISSAPSPLSAKLCSMTVYLSVQELNF